jgi:hypothetical protein
MSRQTSETRPVANDSSWDAILVEKSEVDNAFLRRLSKIVFEKHGLDKGLEEDVRQCLLEKDRTIAEKDRTIAETKGVIAEKGKAIAEAMISAM